MLVHFRRHLWIWPLLFALLLAGFGWLTLRSLETTMQSQVRNELLTTRQAAVAALEIWRKESMASVAVIGADPRIVDSIRSLTELVRTRGENTDALLKAAAAKRLSSILDHFTHDGEFEAWGVITASGYMLANENPDAVGSRPSEAPALLKLARKGKPIFTPPIQWHPEEEKGQPEIAMIAGVPIYDREKRLIALLGFSFHVARRAQQAACFLLPDFLPAGLSSRSICHIHAPAAGRARAVWLCRQLVCMVCVYNVRRHHPS